MLIYLENIIAVKEIYKVHAVNRFFNLGAHYDNENSGFGMSIIKKNPSDCEDSFTGEKKCDLSNTS